MKNLIKCIVLLSLTACALSAQTIKGNFALESGDGKHISSADLPGKVTVIFYETKDNKELNRQAKIQLNNLYYSLSDNIRDEIIRLSVIDCTRSKPFTGVWKKQLVKNSVIEGMIIYGDWNGEMKNCFSFEKDGAYLVILDKEGKIQFFEKGPVSQEKIDKAIEILNSLFPDIK